MIIDSHTHIYLPEFAEDRKEMIQRALDAGVKKMYMPNIDSESIDLLTRLEEDYEGICLPMMGLHPCSVQENYKKELAIIEKRLSQGNYFAVGEIGLDYYWDKTHIDSQKESFRLQIKWAKELNSPIVIHSRDSTQDCIELVKEAKDERLNGIFHCFGGSVEEANQIIELGFYLGIGGVLTYKKSGLDESLKEIDLKHLVLETDAPYLTPVPFRGKRNEPAYLTYIVQRLSEIKEVSVDEVCRITTENAERVFNSVRSEQ
jgi:TatD DNase family protein